MEWIKCSEKMPNYDEEVLILSPQYGHEICSLQRFLNDTEDFWFKGSCCTDGYYSLDQVTYWMPLPAEPEGFVYESKEK